MKDADVDPAGTVTDDGTETALLLLERPATRPPDGAAPDREIEQASVTAPVRELLVQVRPLSAAVAEGATPVPESETVVVLPAAALEVKVSDPLTVPVVVGAKVICSVALCPGLRLSGHDAPESVKPLDPEMVPALMVRVLVPLEVIVMDCVAVVPVVTLPKDKDEGLAVMAADDVGLS